MAVRTILRMGDPRLLQTARPVTEFATPALHELIADMFDTMAAAGGVGLAAPQIGVWEGCLSVPGLRGEVPRITRIRYEGRDPQGRPIDRTVDGFHARVVQHECDHLIGRLYPTRMRDFSRFGFTDVLFPELT